MRDRAAVGGERLPDAKVGHQRGAFVHQDVFGLDVAVDDPLPVRIVEGGGDFPDEAERVGERQHPFAVHPFAKRLPRHVRHDIIEQAVELARIEDRQDVRVSEPGRHANFTMKALGTDIGGDFGAQHLECHTAVVPQVVREVHYRHPAFAELAVDGVAPRQPAVEALLQIVHDD